MHKKTILIITFIAFALVLFSAVLISHYSTGDDSHVNMESSAEGSGDKFASSNEVADKNFEAQNKASADVFVVYAGVLDGKLEASAYAGTVTSDSTCKFTFSDKSRGSVTDFSVPATPSAKTTDCVISEENTLPAGTYDLTVRFESDTTLGISQSFEVAL